MVLGRLPVNGSYVGMCNDDIESDICDCGFDDVETISHFIFECPPRYSHLRQLVLSSSLVLVFGCRARSWILEVVLFAMICRV